MLSILWSNCTSSVPVTHQSPLCKFSHECYISHLRIYKTTQPESKTFIFKYNCLLEYIFKYHAIDVEKVSAQKSQITVLGKVVFFMLAVVDLRGKGAVGNSHHEQVFLKWCLWSKLEWFASALNQWFCTVCELEMASLCGKYRVLYALKGL